MTEHDLDVLDEIQRRVLWLATRIVDAANHDRATGDGVKVGGHQASSASLVTVDDRAVVRAPGRARTGSPSSRTRRPVFHAIQYLLGNLDRVVPAAAAGPKGGLQSYPSRLEVTRRSSTLTGSVGIGATVPLPGAADPRDVPAPPQSVLRRPGWFI